jgi:hypothetical protein
MTPWQIAAAAAAATVKAKELELRRWFVRCPCGAEHALSKFRGLEFPFGREPSLEATCPKCRKRGTLKTVRR